MERVHLRVLARVKFPHFEAGVHFPTAVQLVERPKAEELVKKYSPALYEIEEDAVSASAGAVSSEASPAPSSITLDVGSPEEVPTPVEYEAVEAPEPEMAVPVVLLPEEMPAARVAKKGKKGK